MKGWTWLILGGLALWWLMGRKASASEASSAEAASGAGGSGNKPQGNTSYWMKLISPQTIREAITVHTMATRPNTSTHAGSGPQGTSGLERIAPGVAGL